MNFAKSVLNVQNLVVRSLNLPSRAGQFRSISSIKLSTSRDQCKSLVKIQRPAIYQHSQRLFHVSTKNWDVSRTSSSLVVKKRPLRKKRHDDKVLDGTFGVLAYATADEYNLESLHTALTKQDLYETRKFYTEGEDVLHVRSKYNVETSEPRDIFFFREGSVVLWNFDEPETKSILRNLKQFEIGPYDEHVIKDEKEIMNYAYVDEKRATLKDETFYIQSNDESDLEKYTFSNAMTSSVKLAIWESLLDTYIDGLSTVTTDLKNGHRIRMSRATILQKTGELFALKHLINLDSDLLETPDFYWDREELEQLFNKTCTYFSIPKRKRVSKIQIFVLTFGFVDTDDFFVPFLGH